MKVVLAYNTYTGVSGEQIFFQNISKKLPDALSKYGFDVSCCRIPHVSNPHLAKIEFYSRLPLLINTYRHLKKFENYDVIHFLNASIAPAGIRLKNRVKIATNHCLGKSLFELAPSGNIFGKGAESLYLSFYSRLDRKAYQNLDRLVAITPYQAMDLMGTYGIEKSKIRVIPAGIDIGYYENVQKKDLRAEYGYDEIIVYLGRLQERSKGISYLIRAMKSIERKNVGLLLIGEGPDRRLYEKMIREEGLNEKVKVLGRLDYDTKSPIQKSADVIVVPSIYDVFCLTFAESLACGVPVVAFDMPFWKGLYDDAALFVKKDPKSLAEGIERMLDDKNLRKQVISNGQHLADKYDVNETVKSYVELYRSFLSK